MTSHLTDERFADLLAGESSSETLEHLTRCELCRTDSERIAGALEGFKEQSLAWAQMRSQPAPVQRRVLVAFPKPIRAAAAAAVVLACAAIGGVFHAVGHAPATHAHPVGSLADDNKLLLSIDQELNVQQSSPTETYAAATVEDTARTMVRE